MLSVRSGESWAKSMVQTIWGMLWGDTLLGHITKVHTDVDPKYDFYIKMMKSMWIRAKHRRRELDRSNRLATAMEAYNKEVIAAVPEDRLLVWQIGDGWEPICEFMDLPVPTEPFPHVNESAGFEAGIVRFGLGSRSTPGSATTPSAAAGHPGATKQPRGRGRLATPELPSREVPGAAHARRVAHFSW